VIKDVLFSQLDMNADIFANAQYSKNSRGRAYLLAEFTILIPINIRTRLTTGRSYRFLYVDYS